MKVVIICVLALIASASASLFPGNRYPEGGPAGSSGGAGGPPCKEEEDSATGEHFGVCSENSMPRGVSAADGGPQDGTTSAEANQFFDECSEDYGKPPSKHVRRLSTKPKAIPQGTYGRDCDENCVWVKPSCVFVPFSREGWVKVLQHRKFQQYVRYCWCGQLGAKCNGFMMFYFHWEAACERVFSYRALFVWVPVKEYDPKTWRYIFSYKLRLRWFRFPSACCCGHPTNLVFKYGGHYQKRPAPGSH